MRITYDIDYATIPVRLMSSSVRSSYLYRRLLVIPPSFPLPSPPSFPNGGKGYREGRAGRAHSLSTVCNSIPVIFGFGFRLSLIEITMTLPRCRIALHGRDVYDHTTTVVNFDPMTLAIIFPLLTTDISPNLINALIQCLTTPLSLQTPDQTNTCCGNAPRLMQHVRYFSAAAPAHARGVRRRIAPRRVVWTPSAYITRFRWRFYRFDGGSRRAVCNAETNSFSTIYTPTHYRHRRHHIVRAPGHANDNSIYHARI